MKSNNSINIPEAKEAMEKFKMEAASDFAVPNHINLLFQLPTYKCSNFSKN